MVSYDASRQPDAREWLGTSETDLIEAVREYHRHLREPHPELPEPQVHAAIHVIVENQVALGDETPVHGTIARLMAHGLSRHEALHAVGFVLASHMADLGRGDLQGPADADYYRQLEELTPESWRREAAQE